MVNLKKEKEVLFIFNFQVFKLIHLKKDKSVVPKIFVGRIGKEANEGELIKLFSRVGKIEELKILKANDGRSKGCAFIQFSTVQETKNAIAVFDGKHRMPVIFSFDLKKNNYRY